MDRARTTLRIWLPSRPSPILMRSLDNTKERGDSHHPPTCPYERHDFTSTPYSISVTSSLKHIYVVPSDERTPLLDVESASSSSQLYAEGRPCALRTMASKSKCYIPSLTWIPDYSTSLLGGDFLAGVSVASLLILSRQLNVAPEAAMNLLLGQAVQDFKRDFDYSHSVEAEGVGIAVATAMRLQAGFSGQALSMSR
ncbi:hypothetical protein APHAL10511_007597 [Amanita phalloides]|nr:hypothetical protein APHAL10511_007597 [Amanita phalloides]